MGNSASIATKKPNNSASIATKTTESVGSEHESGVLTFAHAPISYFALDNLTPKGARKNADVGDPHDATRPLVKVGTASVGSWPCTVGGWDSPTPRVTTESFYVLSGVGAVTDLDGTRHAFGPGDLVILPRGWSGRWDISEAIHKVWVVVDHSDVDGAGVAAIVAPVEQMFLPASMTDQGVRKDAVHGQPTSATNKVYSVGTTSVGCWTCTPGSFPVVKRPTTECFHVIEGVFFLTNEDGTARRCGVGDTVVLPKGWGGHWDIIQTVKKVWVVVSD